MARHEIGAREFFFLEFPGPSHEERPRLILEFRKATVGVNGWPHLQSLPPVRTAPQQPTKSGGVDACQATPDLVSSDTIFSSLLGGGGEQKRVRGGTGSGRAAVLVDSPPPATSLPGRRPLACSTGWKSPGRGCGEPGRVLAIRSRATDRLGEQWHRVPPAGIAALKRMVRASGTP